MASGVYEITNTANGKTYVGSAIHIGRRRLRHLDELRRNKHGNQRLQNAFNKYGEKAFVWVTLEIVSDIATLVAAEQRYIDTRKPFYNICLVAGSRLGVKHSEDTKERIRAMKTGARASAETRKKMSRSQTGRQHPPVVRAKISAARVGVGNGMFGVRHTAEALSKIAAASVRRKNDPGVLSALEKGRGWNKGRPFSAASRQKMSDAKPKKPVERVCLRTGEVKFYPATVAVRADGFNAGRVGDCCKGRVNSHKGYVWRYAER